MKNKNQYSIEDLLDVMSELRNKCPWDQKQTFDTLKKLTIEETYELVDAIDKKKYDDIKDELGDLLLHIVFYSKIASENKKFNFNDVLNSLIEKLIYRHPHVYGEIKVSSIDEVKKNWERLKVKDKNKGILSGVPNHLPSLIKAYRVQDKVASIPSELDEYNLSISNDKYSLIYNYNLHAERTGITKMLQDLKNAGLRMRDLKTEQNNLEKIFVTLVKENNDD